LHALSAVNRIRGFLIGFTDHRSCMQPAASQNLSAGQNQDLADSWVP
jgi:hypothetical protein